MRPQIREALLLDVQKRMSRLVERGYEVYLKASASEKTALFFRKVGTVEAGLILEARNGPTVIQVYRHPSQGSVYVFFNSPKARKDAVDVGLEELHGKV